MLSTMIVTCAGCGKRYRGQPSSKRFKCTNCGNHLTFPDSPRVAIGSYHMCSYCWGEFSLDGQPYIQCPTCSQNIVSDFGGKAMPEGSISAGASGIMQAATSGVLAAVQPPQQEEETEQQQEEEQQEVVAQERGADWPNTDAEFSNEMTHQEATTSARTEAEIRTEYAATVANLTQTLAAERDMKKAALTERDELIQRCQDLEARAAALEARITSRAEEQEQASGEREELSQSMKDIEGQLAESASALEQARNARDQAQRERDMLIEQQKAFQTRIADLESRATSGTQAQKDLADLEAIVNELEGKNAELQAKLAAKPAQAADGDAAGEVNRELEARVAGLETRLANERKAKEALSKERDEAAASRRELEAKLAENEMNSLSDRRAKEAALEEREELAEARRELEARASELQKRLSVERDAKEAALKKRDELSEQKREFEARIAELERRLSSEREARETAAKKRDELFENRRDLEAKVADLESRLASDKEIREASSIEREKLTEEKRELEAHIADLETRLNLEKSAKDEMAQERDRIGDQKRQSEAKIAELERRLSSEKEAKESAAKKRDELAEAKRALDGRLADVESRLASERSAKESAASERDALRRDYEQELDARTALEARFSRYRELSTSSLNSFADGCSRAMTEIVGQSAELLSASKVTRKRIEESEKRAQQAEAEAARLQSRLEGMMHELSTRLAKVLPDMDAVSGIIPQVGSPVEPTQATGGENGAITEEDGSWLLKDDEAQQDSPSVAANSGGFTTVKTPVASPAILAEKAEAPEALSEVTDETPGGLAEEYPEVGSDSKATLDAAARTTSSARMEAQKEGGKTFFGRFFGKK